MMSSNKPTKRKAGRKSKRPASDISPRLAAGILIFITIATIIFLVVSAKNAPERQDALIADGNLCAVVTNPDNKEELLQYTGMTVSFNSDTHQPNWVAWELIASETDGESGRESNFVPDESVEGCATTDDYRRSGFDRGHMAPAGDMKWSADAMRESFLLTNICPQAPDLNRGAWKKLEEKCRQRAVADSALVIVCGPIFKSDEPVQRIGRTKVAIPRSFFKVILSPYADPPTAIGFIMPNSYVNGGMQACAVSVDSVEALTGHDFFSALPDDIENRIEAECNFPRWSRIKRK